MRNLAIVGIIVLAAGVLGADQPTEKSKLFDHATHDFGTVPRGAQLLHRFSWTNRDKVRQEVTDLRASCGCATATAVPRVVEPGQTGVIEVQVDAKKFIGQKNVHVQVLIMGERSEAATLELSAHSRPDVVFNPGEVNFGVLAAGANPTQSIEIEYAGKLDWRIEELINENASLDARFEEMYRKPGQAGYCIHVTLKPDAAPGDFKRELQLRTNDPTARVLPVLVQGTVRSRLVATPSPVCFGSVRAKQPVTRRVAIRGDKPFQIVKVAGAPAGMTVTKPTTAAIVQMLTLTWTPTSEGELNAQLTVTTDLDSHGTTTVPVQGQVTP
jgi:uncharacterized protein DUF1573